MTPTTALALLLVGIAATVLQLRVVSAGLADARREVSRYKLFEARDELVRIIASGEMDEDDKDWLAAYGSVSNLLDVHERLDLFSAVKRLASFRTAVERSPALRREVELADRSLRRAGRDVPAFRAALAQIDAGFVHAMVRQTGIVQILMIRCLAGIGSAFNASPSPGTLSVWASQFPAT